MSRLNREREHSVVFMKNGEKVAAKLVWNENKEGFVLRRVSDNVVLALTAYKSIKEFRDAGYMITLTLPMIKTRTKEPVAA